MVVRSLHRIDVLPYHEACPSQDKTKNMFLTVDICAQALDSARNARETLLVERKQPMPDQLKPLVVGCFSVSPWTGTIAPGQSRTLKVTCLPTAIKQKDQALLCINPG